MPQRQLPIFPAGVTELSSELAFHKRNGMVVYFNGTMPIFSHGEDDNKSFKMITAMFCTTGVVKQVDVARAFGVSVISIKRSVKVYKEFGPAGFFREQKRRGAAVLTAEVLATVQNMLDEYLSVSTIAGRLDLKEDTLRKAILAGRLRKPNHPVENERADVSASAKSERSVTDSNSQMGRGATNVIGRVAASLGDLESVPVSFEPCLDVSNGGVMLALPALLACGLLSRVEEYFKWPKGYYGMISVFILFAFMALTRVRCIEDLRDHPPGEWGKLLGLDRVPEVRTLREKLHVLCDQRDQVMAWSLALCQAWMSDDANAVMTLYVDGHVRVYHGDQTSLPKHYVARQRLCLRATVDYWVNDADGQPLFKINQAVDPGLLKVLTDEIVPRLEKDIPESVDLERLNRDSLLHRFTIVFDREGYSPKFLSKMKERRIACLTYHKFPGEGWPPEEFSVHSVVLVSGQRVDMKLAERGIRLSNGLWVKEVRKLMEDTGHQTSILATDYRSPIERLASAMFGRWSQENFFRYAREHYGLDRLCAYGTETIPETTRVVNPAYRDLSNRIHGVKRKLNRKQSELGGLASETASPETEAATRLRDGLQKEITELKSEQDRLKAERKGIAPHIPVSELPPDLKFEQLRQSTKHFSDMINIICYRAETAMAAIAREVSKKKDEVRSLLQSIYKMSADIIPNQKQNEITICLHHSANQRTDSIIQHLCDEMNATQTNFPGTGLRLKYELVTTQNPRAPEV